ncbi:hypothetical protein B0A52_05667 [Exophiala mesophila]|uniref:Low temperature requirement protein A n=1 Tax=Exophiala mesophila TaxID=212818 RepID=A0A438N2B9_EXOME|nr:hypothetical protein B0A52_05667 [Exophiala mesophila]
MTQLRERRYLIRRPRVLQYFHKGQLRKVLDEERVAGRFELFFDLLYVAIIANLADDLAETPTRENLVKFILVFTPAWNAWADAKEYANNYFNDDMLQRAGVIWIMTLLVIYGNNAVYVAQDLGALRATVGSYMVLRFSQICFYAVSSVASHHHRAQNRAYFALMLVGICIWIPLLCENVSDHAKIVAAVVAILYEDASYVISFGPWVSRWLKLDYSSAVDIDHENDRYTAFTILVLGEFTYAILVGSPARGGLNLNVLRAIMTLVIAFNFNSMYVYCDGAVDGTHPIRRAVWSTFAWLLIHLPLSAGLLVGGHVSAASCDQHLSPGQRRLWGAGLGMGTLCLYVFAWLYRDDDPKGLLRFSKSKRLMPRCIAGIVFILLPLTSEAQISSPSLIIIGAVMTSLVVTWEIYGGLETGACMFESWTAPEEDYDEEGDADEALIPPSNNAISSGYSTF